MFRIKILMLSAIVGVAMVMAPTNPVWAQPPTREEICHVDQETGAMHTMTVSEKALEAHRQHIGDIVTGRCTILVGEPPMPVELASKTTICHTDEEDLTQHTITVAAAAVPDHLGHGDDLSACS